MVLVKFLFEGIARWGERTGEIIHLLAAPPYDGIVHTGETCPAAGVRYLAPCDPTKIVAVGKNYADHVAEFGGVIPDEPVIFLKPPTSLNDPDAPVPLPPRALTRRIDYEGELAMVVGKKARNVSAEDASSFILGYTILNDVTARDLQRTDGQWTRAKGFDGFAPAGPVLVDSIDPDRLTIQTRLNGRTVQKSNTARMIWSTFHLFAYITSFMTLLPGDLVCTGTPEGVGEMRDGDVVEIEIEGIGVLRNTAAATESAPAHHKPF